jgi:hypothetical protein
MNGNVDRIYMSTELKVLVGPLQTLVTTANFGNCVRARNIESPHIELDLADLSTKPEIVRSSRDYYKFFLFFHQGIFE